MWIWNTHSLAFDPKLGHALGRRYQQLDDKLAVVNIDVMRHLHPFQVDLPQWGSVTGIVRAGVPPNGQVFESEIGLFVAF